MVLLFEREFKERDDKGGEEDKYLSGEDNEVKMMDKLLKNI
jgi:hypothetical protein